MRIVGPGPSRGRGAVSPNSLEGEASRARIANRPTLADAARPKVSILVVALAFAATALLVGAAPSQDSSTASAAASTTASSGPDPIEGTWQHTANEISGNEIFVDISPDASGGFAGIHRFNPAGFGLTCIPNGHQIYWITGGGEPTYTGEVETWLPTSDAPGCRLERFPATWELNGAFLRVRCLGQAPAGCSTVWTRVDSGNGSDDEVDIGDEPVEPALLYDLRLERPDQFLWTSKPHGDMWALLIRKGQRVEVGQSAVMHVRTENRRWSQRPSLPTTLHFRTAAPLQPSPVVAGSVGPCRSVSTDAAGLGFDCDVRPMAPGGEGRVSFDPRDWGILTEDHHGRNFPFRFDLVCKPPHETDCTNNSLTGRFRLSLPPVSIPAFDSYYINVHTEARGPATEEIRGPRANRSAGRAVTSAQRRPRRTVKRADRPARVDIALVKLAKRQRGFSGAPGPAELPPDLAQAAGNGARQCSWLANRKRKFKQVPAGAKNVCDDPVWLKAKLKQPKKKAKPSRWNYRLKKRLRPGRYVLYSRATTRRGMPEMVFKKGRGNRVEFKVK